MGLMYYKGWGVAQNYDTALEWYKKAAAQGYEVAQRRVDIISMLKEVKPRIQNLERNKELPVPGTIADNNVNVRRTPSTSARSQKKLNSGHPISISGTNEADHEFWYYVKTASGTEGWVLASYVNVNLEPSRTSQEKSNRNYTLPARGYIANLKTPDSKLNVRNLPSMKGSSVKNTAVQGYEVVVSEIFADNEVDWYHVETTPEAISEIVETEGYVPEYTVIDGWISGKYLNITGNKVSSNSQQSQQNSSHQQQAQNTSSGNRATVFSAKDFHDEVAQNPIRAANKYQNEPLIIIGTVEQIGDFFGVPNITVYALGEFGLPVGVIEIFMQKNDPMLTRISKGNTVAIIGCIGNAASYVTSMKDCKVWAVNVNGDWVYGDRVYP